MGYHSSSLDHSNPIAQTVLTIAGSYICFYVAEGIFAASGVMSVVVMGMFLCYTFFTVLADPDVLHHTWHILEWCYNTVLFQMAGLTIGNVFMHAYNLAHADVNDCYKYIEDEVEDKVEAYSILEDMGGKKPDHSPEAVATFGPEFYLSRTIGEGILLYICALFIRSLIVFAFLPLLQRMGYGMTWQGAVIASWGGLRGAVGLALAVVMDTELKENPKGRPEDGMRVSIYIAITVLGTLLINATTTGPLVRKLGLTEVPKVEQKAMRNILRSLQEHSEEELEKLQQEFEWGLYDAEVMEKWEKWLYDRLSLLSGRDYHNLHTPHLSGKNEKKGDEQTEQRASPSPDSSKRASARKSSKESVGSNAESEDSSGGQVSSGGGEGTRGPGMLGKMLNSSLSQAEGSGTMSTSAGKFHLKKLINKVGSSAPTPAGGRDVPLSVQCPCVWNR